MERCAFEENEYRCSALVKKNCEECRFYKTSMQVIDGRKRAEERLDSIRGGLALYKKYHGGEEEF